MSDIKKLLIAIATLTSVIIGTGFFILPYVVSQAGILVTSGYFLILGSLVLLIHLMFAEVALKTPDLMRLPGFAEFHLGKLWKKIALASMIVGSFGALLVYLIMGGEFLTNLLLPIFGGNQLFYTLIYYILVSCFIYFGIKPLAKINFVDLAIFIFTLLVILITGNKFWHIQNFLTPTNFNKFFLPYGPLLFSLWGATIIPEIEEMLGNKKEKLLKKVIWASIIISAIFYFIFVVLISGISGQTTTPDAFSGLKPFLEQRIISLGFFLGIITIFTSFAAIGITLEKIFRYDLKIHKNQAFLIVIGIPLILFIFGIRNFLEVISLTGGIMMGIEGILILLMYKKIKPGKMALVYPLILVFLGGILYEITSFLK